MLDTTKLKSPYLSEDVARAVEAQMVRTERLNMATGDIFYSLTGNHLPGTWSEKVSVRVERTEIRMSDDVQRSLHRVFRDAGVNLGKKRLPVCVPSRPYLILEGSAHKALLGHNVFGGPVDFAPACRWLVDDVGKRLGVVLPDGGAWSVMRADWAEVYDLAAYEGVQEFISGLNKATYPRRESGRYGEHSLHVPGYTTTIKFYHKGVEFGDNDAKRLRYLLPADELEQLQMLANRLLRVEVAVKLRKLREDFGGIPQVGQVTRDYLETVHDREASRLLKEGQSDMETVRTLKAVQQRLHAVYDRSLAEALCLTWMRFAALGQQEARVDMTRATYFRHKKLLQEAGCAWHLADLKITPRISAIPEGFSPVRSDVRRLLAEAPRVVEQLAPYRLAA